MSPELWRAAHGGGFQRGFDPGQRVLADVGGRPDDDCLPIHLPDGGGYFGNEFGVICSLVFPMRQIAIWFVVQFPGSHTIATEQPTLLGGQRATWAIASCELCGKRSG